MLTQEQINNVINLIDEGKSDYAIGKQFYHSPNTINKIRKSYIKEKEDNLKDTFNSNSENIDDTTREFQSRFTNIIDTTNLKPEEKRDLIQILNRFFNLQKNQIIDRIRKERSDIEKSKDKYWKTEISKNYVPNETYYELKQNYEKLDKENNYLLNLLQDLSNISHQKSSELVSINKYNDILQKDIKNITSENSGLKNEYENLDRTCSCYEKYLKNQQDKTNLEKLFSIIKLGINFKNDNFKKIEFNELVKQLGRLIGDFNKQKQEEYDYIISLYNLLKSENIDFKIKK